MFNKKKFMTGAYSIGIAAVAVALVILVNLFAGMLPSSVTKPDVTPEKIATVGADSKNVLKKVDTDITIYRVYSDSYVSQSTSSTIPVDNNIKNLLDKYKDSCSRITLKEIDPAKDPTFISKYTNGTLSQNSLIVESEKRSICVDTSEMYLYEVVGYLDGQYITAEECNYVIESIYNTYYTYPEIKTYFYGENSITGAIDYVISDKIPVIYEITGHGETSINTGSFGNLTTKENIEIRQLTLAAGAAVAVPEDSAAVLINAPTADITKAEADALISYVDGGGDILLYTFAEYISADQMPNLTALVNHMGLEAVSEFICESDADHYLIDTLYILPDFTGEGVSAAVADTRYTLHAPYCHGIRELEGAENVTCAPLVNTTEGGYIFSEDRETEPADEEKQTYSLAYQSTVTDGGSLYWFASPDFISEAFVDYANGEIYRELLVTTCDKPMSVSIIGKDLTTSVVQRTETMTFVANLVLIGIIPIATIATGFAVWYSRRRK